MAQTKDPGVAPNKHWDSYPRATWHGTTPLVGDLGEVGLYLEVGGQIVRYRLDAESARHVAESLAESLSAGARRYLLERCQSPTSCGSPSSDVSTPDEGVKV